MAVCKNLLTERSFRTLNRPNLSETKKELLVTRKAIPYRRFAPAECCSISVVCGVKSGKISDVFSQGLLSVDREIRERFVSVVLRRELFGRGIETRQVRLFPPVAHSTGGIEPASLSVEDVADLVTDYGAQDAIIHRRRG